MQSLRLDLLSQLWLSLVCDGILSLSFFFCGSPSLASYFFLSGYFDLWIFNLSNTLIKVCLRVEFACTLYSDKDLCMVRCWVGQKMVDFGLPFSRAPRTQKPKSDLGLISTVPRNLNWSLVGKRLGFVPWNDPLLGLFF